MKHTGPQVHSTCEVVPVHGNGVTPFSQQTVVLMKPAYIAIRWQANSWRAHHERLVEREAPLKAAVEALQATIRDLTQRLYGAKSEKAAGPDGAGAAKLTSPRKRGQQPGSQGHVRRERSVLPVVVYRPPGQAHLAIERVCLEGRGVACPYNLLRPAEHAPGETPPVRIAGLLCPV